jgi:hypothetical protein
LFAVMVGSAWLASPWARMQAAHSSSNRVGSLVGNVVAEVPLLLGVLFPLLWLLLVPRLATWGEPDPPLQADITMAAAAARTDRPPDRRYLVVVCRRPVWLIPLALSPLFARYTSSPSLSFVSP